MLLRMARVSLSKKLACGDFSDRTRFPCAFSAAGETCLGGKRPVQPDFFDMLRRPALSCAGRPCMLL